MPGVVKVVVCCVVFVVCWLLSCVVVCWLLMIVCYKLFGGVRVCYVMLVVGCCCSSSMLVVCCPSMVAVVVCGLLVVVCRCRSFVWLSFLFGRLVLLVVFVVV